MKKKLIRGSLLLMLVIVIFPYVFQSLVSSINSKLLSDIEGTIYYTKRVGGVNTLFKADATLQNETLIYSHRGKGKNSYGGHNDNIIDFYYDKTDQTIYFIAMHNGHWSLFSLQEGEDKPTFHQKRDMLTETDYIQNQFNNFSVNSKQGSLYISENGDDQVLKKFYGIYDEKLTGYRSIGFSPDGKYFVYRSMERFTPFGTLVEGFFTHSVGRTYIMDLSTMKSTRFIDSFKIQWIID